MYEQQQEPYHCVFVKQHVRFEFWPSKGILTLNVAGRETEHDMKDVLFLHGWIGSMIMTYFDEIKKGKSKHSRDLKEIITASKKLSRKKEKEENPRLLVSGVQATKPL